MSNLFNGLQRSKVIGILALLGIPLGLWGYSAFLSPDTTPINQPIGYVAQDEVTNFNLTSGTETLYRPEYKREKWSGNLHAYPLDAAGNVDLAAERWAGGAAQQISAQNWSSGRFIATMNSAGAGVAFQAANLPSLADTINSTAYTSTQIVNYLRGDLSNAGPGKLRERTSLLGDIVHSRPFFVDGDDATVFVGANDGMLHAINADTGAERWAYVPSMLTSKLSKLAYNTDDASKPFAHDYFVDGQINIGNITISSVSTRVLFGGLGGGGKGLYALNVSTLTASSDADVAGKALWEITPASTGYGHLGYTYGTPQIVKIKNGSASQDALIVGNGYDTTANGESYLYVINATNGALIKAIKAGTVGSANPNGLFNPIAIDTNNDGYVDRVYAGDLNGSMWKFDLSSTTVSSWADVTTPLLTTSPAQPITSTPGVAAHPKGGYMVTFGTGSTLSGAYGTYNHSTSSWSTAATGELANTAVHYVYGIWDGAPAANAALLSQTLTERSYTFGGVTTRVRRVTDNVPDWTSGATHHKGWKVQLPAGERVVGEGSFIENGRFYFNSYNPTIAPTLIVGTDTDIFGENWLMELNYLTGGSNPTPFLDMDSNLLLTDADRIVYTALEAKPSGKVTSDPITSPSEDGIPVGKFISTGVQSQPILVQLKTLNTTLLNQNPDVLYPATTTTERGVAGGHFDVDYFHAPSDVCNPTSGSAATNASGSVKFTYSNAQNITNLSIVANGETLYSGAVAGSSTKAALVTYVVANQNTASTYVMSVSGSSTSTVVIKANNSGASANGGITVTLTIGGSTSNAYTISNLAGGADGTPMATSASTICEIALFGTGATHKHEYDDDYDKTGVNMLNPSYATLKLANAIPSSSTSFKVLLMNQYLNPAVMLHIGDPSYNPTSAAGYVSVTNYQTAAGLVLSTVPSYTRTSIGSLVLNMPVDAFSVKNWWAGSPSNLRVGLQPTSPQCVAYGKVSSSGSSSVSILADLFNPVIPPANGTTGAGTTGTTATGATSGARHNGAITMQIIKASTPDSALEENVTGRPEYGYRIRQANFYEYVLAEYSLYWHHPSRVCYQDSTTTWYNGSSGGNGYLTSSSGAWNTSAQMTGTGWTAQAHPDTKTATASTAPATGSTDPKIGTLGSSGGTVATTVTTVVGNVTTTTITYVDGTSTIITTTANTGGTSTIITTQKSSTGVVTSTTTVTVADATGSVKTGGDERGLTARTGRISWRELTQP